MQPADSMGSSLRPSTETDWSMGSALKLAMGARLTTWIELVRVGELVTRAAPEKANGIPDPFIVHGTASQSLLRMLRFLEGRDGGSKLRGFFAHFSGKQFGPSSGVSECLHQELHPRELVFGVTGHLPDSTELSPRTFWNFTREFSSVSSVSSAPINPACPP